MCRAELGSPKAQPSPSAVPKLSFSTSLFGSTLSSTLATNECSTLWFSSALHKVASVLRHNKIYNPNAQDDPKIDVLVELILDPDETAMLTTKEPQPDKAKQG